MFSFLNVIKVFLLGVIEGVTEWLPVSSTGHMLLLNGLWPLQNVSEGFWETFLYMIQLGAIIAVVILFWNRMWPFRRPSGEGDTAPQLQIGGKALFAVKMPVVRTWLKVVVACIPGAIAEFVLGDLVPETMPVIAAMLILYGVVFIVLELWNAKRKPLMRRMADIDYKTALLIGLFQVLAVVPGTSRSGMTIIAALLLGVSRLAAVEFSFFIAVPVMLGMSAIKLIKGGFSFSGAEIVYLLFGMAVAFVVSMIVIRPILNFIKKHDFKPFGYYRIGLGILIFALLLLGAL